MSRSWKIRLRSLLLRDFHLLQRKQNVSSVEINLFLQLELFLLLPRPLFQLPLLFHFASFADGFFSCIKSPSYLYP
jgi:hypothetical protein